MTATSHALIGTMIAVKVGDPILAIPLSLVSHFVADLVPHWDLATHWREKTKMRLQLESVADVLLGFNLSFILYGLILQIKPQAQISFILIFASIIVAQSPDWLMAPWVIFGKAFPFSKLMYQIQHRLNNKLDKPWGIVTQVVALIALFLILFVIF